MGRFLAGVAAALLLVAAGLFWWKGIARTEQAIPRPTSSSTPLMVAPAPLAEPPTADPNREQKRFDRYDKDHNGKVAREEYLAPRRKAWAKLDTNGDGRLSFEEWAARTTSKFTAADSDHSGGLTPAEFATTRVIRKTKLRCPPSSVREDADD